MARLFRRGDGVTHGTGLALILMQDVVAAHGGSIDVQSRETFPSGTTVTLRFAA